MGFRLVPNSVILDYLERRKSPNRRIILPNSVAFGSDYGLLQKFMPKNLVFLRYITYGDIDRGSPPARALK